MGLYFTVMTVSDNRWIPKLSSQGHCFSHVSRVGLPLRLQAWWLIVVSWPAAHRGSNCPSRPDRSSLSQAFHPGWFHSCSTGRSKDLFDHRRASFSCRPFTGVVLGSYLQCYSFVIMKLPVPALVELERSSSCGDSGKKKNQPPHTPHTPYSTTVTNPLTTEKKPSNDTDPLLILDVSTA